MREYWRDKLEMKPLFVTTGELSLEKHLAWIKEVLECEINKVETKRKLMAGIYEEMKREQGGKGLKQLENEYVMEIIRVGEEWSEMEEGLRREKLLVEKWISEGRTEWKWEEVPQRYKEMRDNQEKTKKYILIKQEEEPKPKKIYPPDFNGTDEEGRPIVNGKIVGIKPLDLQKLAEKAQKWFGRWMERDLEFQKQREEWEKNGRKFPGETDEAGDSDD